MNCIIPLVGRILLSAIFLMSGIGKIFDFSGTQQYMVAAGMPSTEVFLSAAIAFEILGALLIIVGYKARVGAILLILFLVPATVIFHTNFSDKTQMIMFMKNLSILGGLLLIAGFGAGSISLDARCMKCSKSADTDEEITDS